DYISLPSAEALGRINQWVHVMRPSSLYFCAAIVRLPNRIASVNLTFHSHCGALRTRSVKPNRLQSKLQTFV
ncbi:MAG: hypothetical protein ACTS45_00825, partial [Candidatus Hodgkinia cicadicola]